MYDRATLRRQLGEEEGRVDHPYRDSIRDAAHPQGILTVGVGWNLEANGIPANVRALLDPAQGDPLNPATIWPDSAIDALLDIGIDNAEQVLNDLVPAWRQCDDLRQLALLDLAFNMGKGDGQHGLSSFHHFLADVNAGNWDQAKVDLLGTPEHPSKYSQQVGKRSQRVAAQLDARDVRNVV